MRDQDDRNPEALAPTSDLIARRDALLDTVAFSERVFTVERRFDVAVNEILGRLGRAAGVERSYIFTRRSGADGRPRFSIAYEWVAPGVVPEIDHPDWQDLSWDHDPEWLERQAAGFPSVALTHLESGSTHDLLAAHGIRSCCDVPIIVDGAWWGHLGFDALHDVREWTTGELLAARGVADTIAMALESRARGGAGVPAGGHIQALMDLADRACAVDSAGTITSVTAGCAAMLGFDRTELIGRPVRELIVGDRAGRVGDLLASAGTASVVGSEWHLRHADGSVVVVRADTAPILSSTGEPAGRLALITGVTRACGLQERLAQIAAHDSVTGLAGRARLVAQLADDIEAAQVRGMAVAVLQAGLDGASLVADALGSEARDAVLCEAARRVQMVAGEEALVARADDDAFLVLLPPAHPSQAAARADTVGADVARALGTPFTADGMEFPVRASVGIAQWPTDGDDAEAVLRGSDVAMRASRAGGGAPARSWEPPPASPVTGRSRRRTALRRAIERGELTLHFQPIVRLDSAGPPVGVEALVRWPETGGRLHYPRSFIPLAEESGLIGALTSWVVSEASRQVTAWRRDGIATDVFVNLSPDQIFKDGVAEDIAQRAAVVGDAAWLVVEVTESAAMLDPPTTIGFLDALRARGVRVAIDDFGTGYSSLDRLIDMPAEYLKLDRAIVVRAAEQPRAREVVRAIATMAHALDMRLVAEGIETAAQEQAAVAQGCQLGQGFRFGRPAPGDACASLWARGSQP